MPNHDPVLDQLNTLYDRCRTPHRQRVIRRRWVRYPALTGYSVDDIHVVMASPDDPAHNRVAADLLRAHRAGDHDATTVLLGAFRAVVCGIVAYDAFNAPERRALLWAAIGKHLAIIDADQIAASHRPFTITSIGRIRRDARRWLLDEHRHDDVAGALEADVGVHRTVTAATPVEDAAGARCQLSQIAAHIRAGDVTAEQVHELVTYRLTPATRPSTSGQRARITETGQRLATLIGYAA